MNTNTESSEQKGEKILNNKQWSLVILSVLLTIFMLFSLGCSGSTPEEEKALEEVVEILTEDDSEDSADTSATDEPEEEEITEPPVFSFAETYDYPPMASLDEFTNIIGLNEADKEKLDVQKDIEGNNVWGGNPEDIPGGYQGYTDIVFSARGSIVYEPEYSRPPVNALFTCGYSNPEIPLWVVCPPGLNTEGVSKWFMLYLGLLNNTPMVHESNFGTFSAVMDSDNDYGNNYIPHQDFPNDYYNGTDLWFTTWFDPTTYWSSQVTDSNWNFVNKYFFTVFYKNIVVFFIPIDEIPVLNPGVRGTVMWTDQAWSLESYGGDVEGGDPTLPLRPWDSGSKVTFTNPSGGEDYLPTGFSFCRYGGCAFTRDEPGGFSNSNQMVTCECVGCTTIPGCECALFANHESVDTWSDLPASANWEFVAGQNQKTLLEPGIYHSCFCVSNAE